jgi:GMP synthase-like glutamine amidotransferase
MRVLAIAHQPDAGPGVFADAIRATGSALDVWLMPRAEQPPRDLLAYDAVLSLGGAMHPDQDREHPWLARERSVLANLLERDVPLLGVCLGAELLAAAAGAPARRADVPEVGWYEVTTTTAAADDPILSPLAPRFEALEWHSYQLALPPGATPLARSSTSLQAYRVRHSAWGIQFHAEVTLQDFESWLDGYREDPDAVLLGIDADQLRSRTRKAISGWNELGRELVSRFLAAAADRRAIINACSLHSERAPSRS